jgi:hypothetical protein
LRIRYFYLGSSGRHFPFCKGHSFADAAAAFFLAVEVVHALVQEASRLEADNAGMTFYHKNSHEIELQKESTSSSVYT